MFGPVAPHPQPFGNLQGPVINTVNSRVAVESIASACRRKAVSGIAILKLLFSRTQSLITNETKATFEEANLSDLLTIMEQDANQEILIEIRELISSDADFQHELVLRHGLGRCLLASDIQLPILGGNLQDFVRPPYGELFPSFIKFITETQPVHGACDAYLDSNGNVDTLEIGADIFRLLLSDDFKEDICAQKRFNSLLKLFTNTDRILDSLNGITQLSVNRNFIQNVFGSPVVDTRTLRMTALKAVFDVSARQEDGVGSCFASACIIKVQSDHPGKMMEKIVEMFTNNAVRLQINRAAFIPIGVTTFGDMAKPPEFKIHNMLTHLVADGAVLFGRFQQYIVPFVEIISDLQNMARQLLGISSNVGDDLSKAFINQIALKFNQIACDANPNGGFIGLKYSTICEKSAWRKNTIKNMINGRDESRGVYLPYYRNQKGRLVALTRNKYMHILNEAINIAKKLSQPLKEDVIAKISIPGNVREIDTYEGGAEGDAMAFFYFSAQRNEKQEEIINDTGCSPARGRRNDFCFNRPELIFKKWFEAAQGKFLALGKLTKIAASGGGHAYNIDFSLHRELIDHMVEGPFGAENCLQFLRNHPRTVLPFIDANWTGKTPTDTYEIGIVYDDRQTPGKFVFCGRNRDGGRGRWKPRSEKESEFLYKNLAMLITNP